MENDFAIQEKPEYSTKAVRMANRGLHFDSSLNKYCECSEESANLVQIQLLSSRKMSWFWAKAEGSIIAELQSHCSGVDWWKSLDMEANSLITTTCLTVNHIDDLI